MSNINNQLKLLVIYRIIRLNVGEDMNKNMNRNIIVFMFMLFICGCYNHNNNDYKETFYHTDGISSYIVEYKNDSISQKKK